MKKTDPVYLLTWYGGSLAILVLLVVICSFFGTRAASMAFGVGMMAYIIACVIVLPNLFESRLKKNAQEMEKTFSQQNFSYQYKFTAHDGIFYIDTSGRLGVVWRNNPTVLQFADLAQLSDVRVHDGRQLNRTSLVSCRFRLNGKKHKIVTLRVSNGQLSMKDRRVTEAIDKANVLCQQLLTAQQNALAKGGNRL